MLKKKASKIYMFSAAGTALLSVILRIINFFFFFDSDIGYYSFGAVLPVVSNCLLGAAAIFLLVFSILYFRKKEAAYPERVSHTQYIATVLASLSAIALAVSDLISTIETTGGASILAFVLSLTTAIYFAAAISKLKDIFKVLLGLAAIVRIAMLLLKSFTDFSVGMNTPDRVIFSIATASAILFISSEMKLLVKAPRSWLYIFSSAFNAVIGLTASLPSIIAYHAGLLPKDSSFYAEYYLILGIAIYSAIRFLSVMAGILRSSDKTPTDVSES